MTDLGHDAVFVEDAAALRPRLQLCARVLYPGLDEGFAQADRAVDQALARTYALGPDADRTVAAFRALLHPSWGRTRQRRAAGDRVQLRDVAAAGTGDLADDLAALGPTAQAVVVLALLGRLDQATIGRVIATSPDRAGSLFDDALEHLGRTDPDRGDPASLTRQLARLAGRVDPAATANAGIGDLARGRRLARGVRRRRALAGIAAATVVALLAGALVRTTTPSEVAQAPTPSATPTRSMSSGQNPWPSSRCTRTQLDCRTVTLNRWRSRMSQVIVEHLDRRRSYFSTMTWELRPDAASDSYWRGDGGALATGLSRGTGGGTEVYLQIATDEEFADGCGERIGKRCQVFTTMDGNNYRVAGTSVRTGGVEVQYYADADLIITVVASNTSEGKTLDVTAGDLIELVNDTRLQLPRR
ncbi:hypothetical protein [Microlunatus ginsengisoli]|uniref:DNA-directed RNA polymerase specialized sigma subunit, sigma24 family n=1 Tax=Microlunatus ginsengisoli TaxID=363863 RepID=A0ABP7ACL4_9ACTN